MLKFSVILTVILCCSSSTALANYHCEVDVHRVLVYGNGTVNVLHSGRGDYIAICNANGTWNNIDTVTCSLWVATLQMAQNNNKKAIFYYSGDGRCDTLPTYEKAPAPIYIGSIK